MKKMLVLVLLVACLVAAVPLTPSLAQEGPTPSREPDQPSPSRQPSSGIAKVDSATAARRAGPDLRNLRFSLDSDEAQVVSGTQILSGKVRLDVHAADGSALLTIHSDRAERTGETLVVTGNVRVETPENVSQKVRTTGLGSLLESNGLGLSKTVIRARRVTLNQATRTVEIEKLDALAQAKGNLRQGDPCLSLRADRVRLALERGGEWSTRVFKPKIRLRFQ